MLLANLQTERMAELVTVRKLQTPAEENASPTGREMTSDGLAANHRRVAGIRRSAVISHSALAEEFSSQWSVPLLLFAANFVPQSRAFFTIYKMPGGITPPALLLVAPALCELLMLYQSFAVFSYQYHHHICSET